MDDQFNTIAGWALFAGIVGLGLSSVSSAYFGADKPHRPHHMGYEIQGVEAEAGGEQAVPLATLLAEADPAKGERVFAKCASCHTVEAGGANGIGPNLHGVMGTPIGGHAAGFAYSDALKSVGGTWTWEQMDAWLKSPKAFASGTKMTFAGLGKPEDRAALMRYLNSLGSNLALPEAPAVEAEEAAEGEAAAEADAQVPGVGAQPGDSAGPAGAETMDSAAAAGAMAQPALKVN